MIDIDRMDHDRNLTVLFPLILGIRDTNRLLIEKKK